MIADQLVKFVRESKHIDAAMLVEEADNIEEHSVCMVEAEIAENLYDDGRIIWMFAAISVLTNFARCVQEHILSLLKYVADGVSGRKPSQTAVAEVFPSAEQASYAGVIC